MPARPPPLSVETDPVAGPALAAARVQLEAAIAGKQDAATAATDEELSAHTILQPAHGADLAGSARPPTAHGHPQSDVTGLAGALAGKADLVGGVVPTSQVPTLATGQTATVGSQAAMLALTAGQVQPGDVAIRSDLAGRRFLLAAPDPSLIGSWIGLETPDAVSSVNGQQGAITLGRADVGLGSADDTSDAQKPVSLAQQAALDLKLGAVEKAAALGVASLSVASRVMQSPKLHAADHAAGGADALTPADVGAQPLNPGLTAIAALSTTAFGRSLLERLDASAARTLIAAAPVAEARREVGPAGGSAVPAFLSNWSNYGVPYEPLGFYRWGELVFLSGVVKKATAAVAGEAILILPPGFRPLSATLHSPVAIGGRFDVFSSGEVVWYTGSPTNYYAINTFFRVA